MKSTRKLVALLVVTLAVLALGPAPAARAHNDNPRVFPPQAHPYAGAGVLVATLLVGPATVASAAPSGRVADAAANTAGPAIKVGDGPDGIAITPNGKTAYVVNAGSGTVTPISTATNMAGPAIKVGNVPFPSPSRRTARPPTWPTRIQHRYSHQHRHQHGRPGDQGWRLPWGHRHHAGRQDRLRGQLDLGHG